MERKKTSLATLFASFPKAQQQTIAMPTQIQKKPRQLKKLQEKPQPKPKAQPYRKKKISGALREAVWIKTMGRRFEGKCPVPWCFNSITVFDFQAGHNIPESKGGETKLPNLIAICSRCNTSMGNTYTIDEWSKMHASQEESKSPPLPSFCEKPRVEKRSLWQRIICCFSSSK